MTEPGPPCFSERKGLRYVITPILAALTILVLTSPVQARMAATCSGTQTAKQELTCGKQNLHHARAALGFLQTHPWAGSKNDRAVLRRDMTWLKKYATQHISTAYARLNPLPAHNAGWNCIQRHEGSWGDTGDPYWGGLQMHPGWGGVEHASDLSPLGQKWLAERELRKNNYSRAWVASQWPISHLSCMQYF